MRHLILCLIMLAAVVANAREAKVVVKGMVCAFCAQGISKKLKAQESVEKVDVSLEKKLVTISFKDAKDLSNEKIESILKDAGYTVEKIDRK